MTDLYCFPTIKVLKDRVPAALVGPFCSAYTFRLHMTWLTYISKPNPGPEKGSLSPRNHREKNALGVTVPTRVAEMKGDRPYKCP